MSSLVSCLLTLRLHLNDCDFDSRPLFLVSIFLSLYIYIYMYILLLLLYTMSPGTDKTGTGLSSVEASFRIGDTIVCVCCFVLLNRYWGIVTVPGSIPYGSRPGVAGSSPFTLITSLAIPVPSSSSSNGPTTVTLITMGLCHGSSVAWEGPKFVRPHW